MKFSRTMFADVKVAYQNRQEPEYLLLLGRWYWRVLVSCTFLLAACSIVYSILQFMTVTGFFEEVNNQQTYTPRTLLNKQKLSETLQNFADRKMLFDTLQKMPPNQSDPSR